MKILLTFILLAITALVASQDPPQSTNELYNSNTCNPQSIPSPVNFDKKPEYKSINHLTHLEFKLETSFQAATNLQVNKIDGHNYHIEGKGFGTISFDGLACKVTSAYLKSPSEHQVTYPPLVPLTSSWKARSSMLSSSLTASRSTERLQSLANCLLQSPKLNLACPGALASSVLGQAS